MTGEDANDIVIGFRERKFRFGLMMVRVFWDKYVHENKIKIDEG